MNAVLVMRELLLGHPPVVALVGENVTAGDIDYNQVPAIGLSEISRREQDTVGRTSRMVIARVQVTVHAKDYAAQKELLHATRLGDGVFTGTVAGVEVRSVLRDTVGPDLGDPAADLYQQSRDFIVTYLEPA
ncbi:hypothetical protein [Massilia sp. BHUDP2]|uniref:hypothetical protein n=1 Tax=Massilia sp. BHUDP2 TaxID=3034505 RepID=UPI003906762C